MVVMGLYDSVRMHSYKFICNSVHAPKHNLADFLHVIQTCWLNVEPLFSISDIELRVHTEQRKLWTVC